MRRLEGWHDLSPLEVQETHSRHMFKLKLHQEIIKSLCLCPSVSVSLSLSHTHTHTPSEGFSSKYCHPLVSSFLDSLNNFYPPAQG